MASTLLLFLLLLLPSLLLPLLLPSPLLVVLLAIFAIMLPATTLTTQDYPLVPTLYYIAHRALLLLVLLPTAAPYCSGLLPLTASR